MAWPTPQDYNEAVQNPRLAFADADLRSGQPALDKIGLPRPISGGFACVYKIQSGGSLWAARCFLSEVTDQQQRYDAISKHLAAVKLPHTVQFSYLPGGIKVQGKMYPLVKMQWVQGESLSAFVGRSIGYPETLLSLAKVWMRLLSDLKGAQIAHGDLQHGNVIVVGDQLRLLDYDGMFVPSLSGKHSNEFGHRNYQLPTRSRWDYGPHLDNFSAWVIYVSLAALAVHPELWAKHQGGDECLIFRKEDFAHPESSAVLADLNSSPNAQLRILVEVFVNLFNLSPQDIPSLDGNLTKITVTSSPRPAQAGTDWWSDHVDRKAAPPAERESENATVGEGSPVVEERSPIGDLGWIIDSLSNEKAVEQAVFKRGVKEIRILMAGSMALVALMSILVNIPASQIAVLTSCAFGLNLLFCYVRFKNDPSQAEFTVFKKESHALAKRVREQQTLIDSISAERSEFQEKLLTAEREINEQKDRLTNSCQEELNAAQAELDSKLKTLNHRRRALSSSETEKLNSIQNTLGNQIPDYNRRIAAIDQREADEKNKVLAPLVDYHINLYLRGHRISESGVPGIGPTYQSRLANSGFLTAADVTWRVSNVQGIGPARQAALMRWRQDLENMARAVAPKLSPAVRQGIEDKYRQERSSLESAKQQCQAQFNAQITSTRQYFADARQLLSDEEQQLRSSCAQVKNQIQKDRDTQTAQLDQKLIAGRNQAAPTMNDLTQKLQQAQKQMFGLRWQTAKREKDGQRVASLRFRNYLLKIVKP